MKKLLSLYLVCILTVFMVWLSVFSVGAVAVDEELSNKNINMGFSSITPNTPPHGDIIDPGYSYGPQGVVEVYRHVNSEGAIDWILHYCGDLMFTGKLHSVVHCGYVMTSHFCPQDILPYKYCVMDIETGKLESIAKIDIDKFEGLREYLESYICFRPLGDADGDRELSVFDATHIQRVLAKMDIFDEADIIEIDDSVYNYDVKYFSDMNMDGERTVLDVTAIQRKLAVIE